MASQPSPDTNDHFRTRVQHLTSEVHRLRRQIAGEMESPQLLVTTPPPNSYQSDMRLVLLTERQRELVWYYETFGFAGLCYWIYHIALAFIEQEVEEKAQTGSGSTARSRTLRRSDTSCSADDDYQPSSSAPDSSGARLDETNITDLRGEVDELSLSARMHADDDNSSDNELEDGGHKSWRDIRDDWEQGMESRMLSSIASLPPDLISAILYRDLPFRMQDRDFFSRVGAWVNCSDAPGVYGTFVAISPTARDPAARSIGAGPCLEHMLKAIDTMWLYIDIEDPSSREISKKIDGQFDPAPKVGEYNYGEQRKYAGSADHRSFDLLDQGIGWLHQVYHEVEKQLRSTDDLHLLNESMRCPVYIGMSSNPSSRGPRHRGRPDSKLLGLFLSTMKYLYGDIYEIGAYTYQLFYGLHEEDIGFLEIVASILGSGFPWDGGLAYTYAGGRPHGMHEIHKQRMGNAAEMISKSGNIEHNLKDSVEKMNRLKLLLDNGLTLNFTDNHKTVEGIKQQNSERAEALSERLEMMEEAAHWAELQDWFAQYTAS